ncbi:sugar transporter ERD6-like 5 isoform X2 [Spinacia oleracea]|uniref:Sugar transporter ERD6-like 5 isoform X2 n=1 Tax=Spinacia oleracea TaxID=3562 RepID=A0ABM3QGX0_SPIOL|nr:sugar transporter ERD6-like 5 isoform X2 [Spinacia oleracea]
MKEEMRVQLLLNIHNNNDKLDDEADNGLSSPQPPPMDTSLAAPITPMLLLSVFIAVVGSFSAGFVVGYTSPVQTELIKELDLSTAQFSLFGSLVSVGSALGSVVCGKLTDYLGRRHVLQLTSLVNILGWFAISVSQGTRLLDLGRWMLGFTGGVCSFAIPVYVAEFTPKNFRGGFVILHVLMITVGASAAFLIGLITSWRTLALIGMIPNLVQIVGVLFIPESPRWLMMMGKNKEFEAALQCFRGGFVDISQEAADIRDSAETLDQIEKVSTLQLFQRKYAYAHTVGIGLSALGGLVGLNGIMFYAGSIFESAGFPVKVGTAAVAFFQMYVAFYPIGVGGGTCIIISEIYPLNIKGSAGSIAAVVSSLSSWIVSYAFNFSMEWSSSGTFFVMAGVCVFTLIFVAKLVPETKGKTLEEVHMTMSNAWQ